MASYAVQARVQTRVRTIGPDRRRASGASETPPPAPGDVRPIDLVPAEGTFERMRTLWAQTTFFLFDGDSWRR